VTTRTHRALPAALVAALLALGLTPLLAALTAAPARAAAPTVTISLTANGPKPASTTAVVGDTVTFVNDDMTFVHQVGSKSTNWTFQSRPLAPGDRYTTPVLTKPGEYDYQGINLDSFSGKVDVPGSTPSSAAPAPAPSTSAAAAPSHAASPAGSPSPGASASPSAGTAVAIPPPLAGGFGAIGIPGSPAPGLSGPPPAVAPPASALPGEDVTSPEPSGSAVAVASGRLPEPPTGRRYGLPAALAAVAAAGVASLLVRVLLAHPAARGRRQAGGVGDIPATVD
jgi:plastocyanin